MHRIRFSANCMQVRCCEIKADEVYKQKGANILSEKPYRSTTQTYVFISWKGERKKEILWIHATNYRQTVYLHSSFIIVSSFFLFDFFLKVQFLQIEKGTFTFGSFLRRLLRRSGKIPGRFQLILKRPVKFKWNYQ